MTVLKLPPPSLVDTPAALNLLISELSKHTRIAVDTESNSLHAYQEQVCLIQFSTPQTDYLVDPLALDDISSLAEIFANPNIEKIFHAIEYDVICLSRDFGFTFANIFDTMQAARTLGYKSVGLGNLLKEKFDISLDKRFQKADWGQRPLSPALIDYARLDTHYLIALRDLLDAELQSRARQVLAYEDFKRLCHPLENNNEKNHRARWERIANGQDLTPRELTILNELCLCREKIAEKFDRPVFKVIGDNQLLEIAKFSPDSREALSVSGLSKRQIQLFGTQFLAAVQIGQEAPLVQRTPFQRPNDAIIRRFDKLKAWRKKVATKMGVESDIILPRVYMSAIAEDAPRSLDALEKIMEDSPWRLENYGTDILKSIGIK